MRQTGRIGRHQRLPVLVAHDSGTDRSGPAVRQANDGVAARPPGWRVRTTLTERRSPINAATLRAAHVLVESGTARGKITVEGF